MNRFAVAFVVLGLFATYGWLAVVAILLLIIGYLPLAAYGCLLDEQEAAAALQEAQERRRLRSTLASVGRSERPQKGDPAVQLLYHRVGLADDCPDFVVEAVRKAYRKALHPEP